MSRRTGIALALLPAAAGPILLAATRGRIWPAAFVYHLLCLGAPLVLAPRPLDELRRRGEPRRWLPVCLGFVVALSLATQALLFAAPDTITPVAFEPLLDELQPFALFTAYSLLVNPLAEEVYWRGLLLPSTGILGGAALFWLMHVTALWRFLGPAALTLTLPALAAGLLWGFLRRRFGTVWPCVLTHLAADAALLHLASRALSR